MNRPIKFRQWLGDRFEYWGIGVSECTFAGPCSGGGITAANTMHQQFTGILDKNGKDVYDGDLIIAKDYPFYGDDLCEKELNYVGEVFWDDEGLRWYYEMHVVSNRVRGAACGDVLCNQKHDEKTSSDWEVIGNIYENSELITPC